MPIGDYCHKYDASVMAHSRLASQHADQATAPIAAWRRHQIPHTRTRRRCSVPPGRPIPGVCPASRARAGVPRVLDAITRRALLPGTAARITTPAELAWELRRAGHRHM
jgi:hypothetical protein